MKKVLVILPNNLGDVIMALPVLEGMKRSDPQVHCTFFVEHGFEAGLLNNPWCDRIFHFDRKSIRDGIRTTEWHRSMESLDAVVKELRAERFDKVLNLSQYPYAAIITGLLSCADTMGTTFLPAGNHAVRDSWTTYLYAIPFARHCNRLHATDVFRRIAGVSNVNHENPLPVNDTELANAREWLTAKGLNAEAGKIMVLQPGAAYQAKCWPIEHFAALGRMLVDAGWQIVISGAPAEAEIACYLGSMIRNAQVTAGELTFRQTIALLPFAAGCVTGDTAIMHAAAALKRRVYTLFGPTSPVETGPYGPGHYVFSGRCPSRPCFCFECKTRLCMKSISPSHVYNVIQGGSAGESGSDLYRTIIDPHGMAGLDPVIEKGTPYYSRAEAAAAIRYLEPEFRLDSVPTGEEMAGPVRETVSFCTIANAMVQSLAECDFSRPAEAVHKFETLRAGLVSLTGIGAFWTALLNLQLNSVPLLDPVSGIKASRDICVECANRAAQAIDFHA